MALLIEDKKITPAQFRMTGTARYWFTSDLHFGHHNIIGYCNRPWWDVESMNQGLVDRWNAVVGDDDIVHVLGDLCWGKPSEFESYLRQLKGRKILTPGNHDTMWSGHKTKSGKKTLIDLGWRIMDNQWTFRLADRVDVKVCHFPYTEDGRHGLMYAEHRPEDDGGWLLHGHVHNSWQTRQRMINVGVDVWEWTPVPEEEISALIIG